MNPECITIVEEEPCEHPNIDDAPVIQSGDCACGCRDYRACPDCDEEIEVGEPTRY